MLKIKSKNNEIRVYGYFNLDDYISITANDVIQVTSAPTSDDQTIYDVVAEIYEHFDASSFEELKKIAKTGTSFVLGNKIKIDKQAIIKEMLEDGEVVIELDIDKELDTAIDVDAIINTVASFFDFEIEGKFFEFKSKKGYVTSRDIYFKKKY